MMPTQANATDTQTNTPDSQLPQQSSIYALQKRLKDTTPATIVRVKQDFLDEHHPRTLQKQ